jgi:predicted  nucleic acid-binding Zn-ribbon protein
MAMAASKLETETISAGGRIARLESHVEHMQTTISDLKIDLRQLTDRIEAIKEMLNERIDHLRQ